MHRRRRRRGHKKAGERNRSRDKRARAVLEFYQEMATLSRLEKGGEIGPFPASFSKSPRRGARCDVTRLGALPRDFERRGGVATGRRGADSDEILSYGRQDLTGGGPIANLETIVKSVVLAARA